MFSQVSTLFLSAASSADGYAIRRICNNLVALGTTSGSLRVLLPPLVLPRLRQQVVTLDSQMIHRMTTYMHDNVSDYSFVFCPCLLLVWNPFLISIDRISHLHVKKSKKGVIMYLV